ncbi:FtsK/SpoIIIE domain-containing protein [Saccharothrix violaceirubra]|uniref:S-DNA-T family DNA segregation ATPase FtsK/SpoIIIE n=1 Tax=Saccharothrix violaceirubra TaxID=413306 RepID=A0A7W7T6J7_9PSEU|nr:FtsK/SpoIIIE domain-containing protein [Saccharothrix violaceirubra]MBB4967507.1 S-DNA-T family DNA segregation ATPase FtsK/SpoIIIE [Saccharothrix violaceirubra]
MSRWVDPAPFEGVRPRLPWWMLLPGKLKCLAVVVALAWLVVVALGRFVLTAVRYPVTFVAPLVAAWCVWRHGWWPVGLTCTGLAGVLALWAKVAPHSFRRLCWYRLVTEWRRAVVYAPRWRTVMRLAELTKDVRGREYRPSLRHVRSEGWRDRVRVRMIPAQSSDAWELRRDGLAHSFGARSCRIRVLRPRVVELDFMHSDPLSRSIPAPALVDVSSGVDLKRVTVGCTESGSSWRIRLQGNQVLGVGVQGSGKASVLWSIVWHLAPAIRDGLVRLVGVDPKGGMELGQCPEAFDRVVYDNGVQAVELLEDLAVQVKDRADRYRGVRRLWTRVDDEPFTVLVVDELADLVAYQSDQNLRERASRALQTIVSQGRAPGFCVLALVQDPRKEVVGFRHLFGTRIALRLDEPVQVDMVLGDGVRAKGAAAHEIDENTPGVAWVKTDGRGLPERVRAFHVTDTDLLALAAYLTDGEAA